MWSWKKAGGRIDIRAGNKEVSLLLLLVAVTVVLVRAVSSSELR